MKEICTKKKCKDCKEQLKCFGCETHNFILINQDTTTNTYKCSKCGDIIRLNKSNVCCECVYNCKGKVTNEIDKDKGIYKICNKFYNGEKEYKSKTVKIIKSRCKNEYSKIYNNAII